MKIAQGIDGQIGSKFGTFASYGETLSKSPEELLKLFPLQNSSDSSSNNQILTNIQTKNGEILKMFESLKEILAKFNNEFSSFNFGQEIINAKKIGKSANEIFKNHSDIILLDFSKLVFFSYDY